MNKYENRVVAFIDILGFKELVLDSNTKQSKVNQILTAYNIINETIYELRVEKTKPQHFFDENPYYKSSRNVSIMSDSIVISFNSNIITHWIYFFQELSTIHSKLAKNKILIRGAVSIGKIIHCDEFIFGPALVDAYLKERDESIFPRIILSDNIISYIKKNFNKYIIKKEFPYSINDLYELSKIKGKDDLEFTEKLSNELLNNDIIVKDLDGFYYIDYINDIISQRWNYDDSYVDKVFKNFEKIIIEGKKSKSQSVLNKIMWLEEKYKKGKLNWQKLR